MNRVTFTKLPIEGGIGYYFSRVEWFDGSFSITLLENDTVWSGKASSNEISDFCKQVDLNVNDYLAETRKALATHGGADNFSYYRDGDNFVWKKLGGNIKIKFGCVNITKAPGYSSLNLFVENVLDEVNTLQDDIRCLREGKEILVKDKVELMKKLEHFVDEKSHQEAVLYGKFLSLLNVKKEKILDLQTLKSGGSPELEDHDVDEDEPQKQYIPTLPKRKDHKARSFRKRQDLGNGDNQNDSDTDIEQNFGSSNSTVTGSSKNTVTSHTATVLPRRKRPAKSGNVHTPQGSEDSDTDIDGEFAVQDPVSTIPPFLPKRKRATESSTVANPLSNKKDEYHYDSDTEVDDYDDDDDDDANNALDDSSHITILPKRVPSNKIGKKSEIVADTIPVNHTQFDSQFLFADDE